MKKLLFLIIILGAALSSCTKEKTAYGPDVDKPVVDEQGFKDVVVLNEGPYTIRLAAQAGQLYTGYNALRLAFELTATGQKVYPKAVRFLPLYKEESGEFTSCPHLPTWERNTEQDDYFSGYAVFNQVTNATRTLDLNLNFTVGELEYRSKKSVKVDVQSNLNRGMTEFVGNDGERYYLALIAPQKPKIGENALVAGLYKYNKPAVLDAKSTDPALYSFSTVNNFKILLDPRMPDPSMGNHSSPNNKDLVQQKNGLYQGVVNYTMTGKWALNFMLLDDQEQLQKGTIVSTAHTPGVEGQRSELYLDIVF